MEPQQTFDPTRAPASGDRTPCEEIGLILDKPPVLIEGELASGTRLTQRGITALFTTRFRRRSDTRIGRHFSYELTFSDHVDRLGARRLSAEQQARVLAHGRPRKITSGETVTDANKQASS